MGGSLFRSLLLAPSALVTFAVSYLLLIVFYLLFLGPVGLIYHKTRRFIVISDPVMIGCNYVIFTVRIM